MVEMEAGGGGSGGGSIIVLSDTEIADSINYNVNGGRGGSSSPGSPGGSGGSGSFVSATITNGIFKLFQNN